MKSRILSILTLAALTMFAGCKDPEELVPPVAREGLNAFIASFPDDERDENRFLAEINHETGEVVVVIPWYYPETSDNVLTSADITKMKVTANIDDNVVISPAIHWMDLTKENRITVTDQRKVKRNYTVRGEIRKSNKAEILEFSLPGLGISSVVNADNKSISLISVEPIEGKHLANYGLSLRARISPDPATVEIDYSQEVEFTVTADDGVTKNIYKVNRVLPPKLRFGMRDGSGKVLWAKKLKDDIGITTLHLTGGIAVNGDYLVLNTRNEPSVYLNRKTGEKVGAINLGPDITGGVRNFYNTSDEDGNILICNLRANDNVDGKFNIWKLTSVTGQPELLIGWETAVAIGRKVSVKGSVDKNAIITAPIYSTTPKFARWTIVNGVLTSHTPDVVDITGMPNNWGTNSDVIYTSDTDVESDYFVNAYMPSGSGISGLCWINGKTNQPRKRLADMNSNFVANAVDHTIFNGMPYVMYNYVNSQPWGAADQVYLVDVSSLNDFTTVFNQWGGPSIDNLCIKWVSEVGIYGGLAMGMQNTNGTGDVILKLDDNGFYMYAYFMFTNGYVVCSQFDCIDMSKM